MKVIHPQLGELFIKLSDVHIIQMYRDEFNRWKETAIIFKNKSILWEGCGFTYLPNGSEYIIKDRVTTGGFSGIADPVHIDPIEYKVFLEDVLEESKLIQQYYIDTNDDYNVIECAWLMNPNYEEINEID